MKLIYLLPFLLFFMSCSDSIVDADDENISYWGRVDFSNEKVPTFEHTGVTIRAKFTGTSVSVVLTDWSDSGNYFYVVIDDKSPEKIKVSPGRNAYHLANNLREGSHTIDLVKLTEAFVGRTSFEGFVLDDGATLETRIEPTKSIEFIGNSVTCGYGNEISVASEDAGTGYHAVNQNSYNAWGYRTARNLGMKYTAVAYSGKGMYRNYDGDSENTLPQIYDRIFPHDSSPGRDSSTQHPDVVVINLGANDFAKDPSEPLSEEVYISTYVDFVKKISALYPAAHIICATGVTTNNHYPKGANHWTRLTMAVKSVVKKSRENGLDVHFFEMEPQSGPFGEDWHPSSATHERMANDLTEFIKGLGF